MPPLDPYRLARYGLQPGDSASTLSTLVGYPPGTVVYVPSAAGGNGADFEYQQRNNTTPDGSSVIGAPGGGAWVSTSGGAPAALSQPAFFVDQMNLSGLASDRNNGLTANTPLLTDAERQRRWGGFGVNPALPSSLAACTITYLSGSPDGTDPILIAPQLFGTLLIVTMATPPSRSTGTLANVTAKTISSNQALQATLPAGTVAGDLVVNGTRSNSYARAYKNLGSNVWQLTQPIAALAAGTTTILSATQDNTWANTDAFTVYRGPTSAPSSATQWNLNICRFAPVQYVAGASLTNAPTLRDVNLASPISSDFGFDTMQLGGGCRYINCAIGRKFFLDATCNLVWQNAFQGCFISSGGSGGTMSQATLFQAGGNTNTTNNWPLSMVFDCDFMMAGGTGASFIDAMSIVNIGTLYVDQGNVLPGGPNGGFCVMVTTYNGTQPAVYGAGGVSTWTMLRYSGNAVNSFPCSGGLKIRGQTLAYSATTSAGSTAWRQLALSASALDAAGPSGFGGYAVWPDLGGYLGISAPP